MSSIPLPYAVKRDSENRITLSNAAFSSYVVEELPGGCILLRPETDAEDYRLSLETFDMIVESARNFEKGIVSDVIDLSEDDGIDLDDEDSDEE